MRPLPIARWSQVAGVLAYIVLFAAAQFHSIDKAVMLAIGSIAALAIVLGGATEFYFAARRQTRR